MKFLSRTVLFKITLLLSDLVTEDDNLAYVHLLEHSLPL